MLTHTLNTLREYSILTLILEVRYTLRSSADAGTQVSTVVQSEHIRPPCYASESLSDTLGLSNAVPTPFSLCAPSAYSHMNMSFTLERVNRASLYNPRGSSTLVSSTRIQHHHTP